MKSSPEMIYTLGAVAFVCGIGALVSNKARNAIAGLAAITGAALPWFVILSWHNVLPNSNAVMLLGLFGCSPAFLFAAVLYGVASPKREPSVATWCSIGGFLTGLLHAMAWFDLLAHME